MGKSIFLLICGICFIYFYTNDVIEERVGVLDDLGQFVNSEVHSTSILNINYQEAGTEELLSILRQTVLKADTITLSGKPDYDFALLMQIHFVGGIAMADLEIDNGKIPEIVKMAEQLKEDRMNDLDKLVRFTDNNSTEVADKRFLKEIKAVVQESSAEISNNMADMSYNLDMDFASVMYLHHMRGQQMAKLELKYGHNEEMKELAQKYLKIQEEETALLEQLTGRE